MNPLRGVLALLVIAANTILCCAPLFLLGLVRAPCHGPARLKLTRWMDGLVDVWVWGNRRLFRALRLTDVTVDWEGAEQLDRQRWYLVVSNHQSWADILVLQNTLWGHIPPLKFFTKRELVWVPLVGVAMWLLGFPYVRRAGRDQVSRNPELLARDREATLAACQGFRTHPTTVLNFLEGTRFTPAKHAAQDARYHHLLNPKLGGLSYVVSALQDRLHKLVDVTIVYPDGIPTFWALLQGRCRQVRVRVRSLDLPRDVLAAPDSDAVRASLGPWIDAVWQDKDELLVRAGALPN